MKENKKMITISYIIIILGFIFGITETIYFGNNLTPQSKAEAICDDISVLLISTGFYFFIFCFIIKLLKF